MPIIPRATQNAGMQVSSPVPIGSTTGARYDGEVAGQLADQVTEFAGQMLRADRALKKDEGANELTEIHQQSSVYADTHSAPDGSDYAEKMREYAEPRIEQTRSKFGSDPEVSRFLESYNTRVNSDMQTTAYVRSSMMKAKNNAVEIENSQDVKAASLRKTPTPEMLEATLTSQSVLHGELAMAIPGLEAQKLNQMGAQIIAREYINGMMDRKEYGRALGVLGATQEVADAKTSLSPEQAVSMGLIDPRTAQALAAEGKTYDIPVLSDFQKNIKLTPAETAAINSLELKERDSLINSAKSQLEANSEMRMSDFNDTLHGFENNARRGDFSAKSISAMKEKVNSLAGKLPAPTLAKIHDKINAAVAVGEIVKMAASTPRGKMDSLLNSFDKKMNLAASEAAKHDPRMADVGSDEAVKNNRHVSKEFLSRQLGAIMKEQEEDPVQWALNNRPELANALRGTADGVGVPEYQNKVLSYQKFLGIPLDKQRVLSDSQAFSIKQTLKAIPNASDTAAEINKLQSIHGANFPRVMAEVAGKDKELQAYAVVAHAPPYAREDAVDSIKFAPQIKAAAEGDDKLKEDLKLVDSQVAGHMAVLNKVIMGSSNDLSGMGATNALSELVSLTAKKRIVKSGMEVKEAVRTAYQDVVESAYTVASGGKSSTLVPRVINNTRIDPELVEAHLSVYSKSENFSDLGIAIPKTETRGADDYYRNLAHVARWVPNKDQTGVVLMQVETDGKLQPVYNKYGVPIQKSYENIFKDPGEKVLNESKFLKKVTRPLREMFGG